MGSEPTSIKRKTWDRVHTREDEEAKAARLLPQVALSIRQPWAWLIVNGWKTVENRTWETRFRGPVLIHAGKKVDRAEYGRAEELINRICATTGREIPMPSIEDLDFGGFVGVATIEDCLPAVESPFFFGPWGFVISGASPLPFRPHKGALGFFSVK